MATKDPVALAMAELGIAQNAAKELTDGAIRCTIPECGGIVKAAFVIPTKTPVGLCPQKEVHDALKAKNPAVKGMISGLLTMYKVRKIQG
jgi:hypothetical protein